MAGFFQAFATGAATTITESIKREEKNARELAAAQASMLIENHAKVKDARDKQANKMIEDAKFLQAQFPTVSNDELVMAATNPSAIAALRARAAQPDWDPTVLKFSDFAQVTTKATGQDIDKIVNGIYDMSAAKAATDTYTANKNMSIIQRITAGTGEEALNKIISPFGLSAEQMRGQVNFKPKMPEGEVKFNLGALTQRDYAKEVDKTRLKLLDAQNLPEEDLTKDAKISAATKELAMAVAIKDIGSKDLNPAQIVSNLISQIQDLPEGSPQRKELQKKLDERQKMEKGAIVLSEKEIRTNLVNEILQAKKDKDTNKEREKKAELNQRKSLLNEEETDPLKISATNLQVTATKAIAAAVNSFVPAGDFTTTTNLDGSQTTSLKSLSKTADYDKGMRAGHEAVYELYTKKGEGVARSQAHALALSAVGFRIDPDTLKVLAFPQNPRAGTPPPAAPAPAKPPAAPAAAAPAASLAPAPAPAKPVAAPAPKTLPSGTKTATMADVNIFAAQQKLTPAQIITELKNKGYKIVD